MADTIDVRLFDNRFTLTLDEVAAACGLGRSSIEVAIREGELEARYYGRKPLLTPQSVQDWIATLPTEKP